MLEAEFVARSEELKERALRRRALAIVATLGQAAARGADEERARDDAARSRFEAMAHVGARLDRDADGVATRIAFGLAAQAAAWTGELALVVSGRDRQGIAGDTSLARYRVDRALAHLARPLAQALAGAADGSGLAPGDLAPIARASVRAFASIAGDDPPLGSPSRGARLASLVEHLTSAAAVSLPLHAPPGSSGSSARSRRRSGKALRARALRGANGATFSRSPCTPSARAPLCPQSPRAGGAALRDARRPLGRRAAPRAEPRPCAPSSPHSPSSSCSRRR